MNMTALIFISMLILAAARAQGQIPSRAPGAVLPPDRAGEIATVIAASANGVTTARAPGIRVELRGIYVLDGLLWFVVRVRNTSVFDWHATPMRFSIRDRHTWRRRARQELSLSTILRREPFLVSSDSSVFLCYALAPRLPAKNQCLILDYTERSGSRHLSLSLSSKQLLKAKKLEQDLNGSFRVPTD